MNGCFLGDDATGLGPTSGFTDLRVLLDPVNALDKNLLGFRHNGNNFALDALVLTGDDLNEVTLLDRQTLHDYNTSGASEMIFMKRFSRSSRPTGPKMRVPRGSPSPLRMTAAFSSKRM